MQGQLDIDNEKERKIIHPLFFQHVQGFFLCSWMTTQSQIWFTQLCAALVHITPVILSFLLSLPFRLFKMSMTPPFVYVFIKKCAVFSIYLFKNAHLPVLMMSKLS